MDESTTLLDGIDEAVSEETEEVEFEEESTTDEAEETEQETEAEAEEVVYEIDGEEISADDFETMKKQQMLHKDFTQKTQQLSDDRRTLETTVRKEAAADLRAHIQVLEDMIGESTDDIDLDMLSNSEFRELQKKEQKRKDILANAKKDLDTANNEMSQTTVLEEQQKLVAAVPEWTDSKGVLDTDKVNSDFALINKYAADAGISLNTQNDHKIYVALLDAARFKELKSKSSKTTKRVVKGGKSTKPSKKGSGSRPKTRAEKYYGTS